MKAVQITEFGGPEVLKYRDAPDPAPGAGDVLSWVKSGELKLRVERLFPLPDAAEAHRQLEGRATTGKLLLIP